MLNYSELNIGSLLMHSILLPSPHKWSSKPFTQHLAELWGLEFPISEIEQKKFLPLAHMTIPTLMTTHILVFWGVKTCIYNHSNISAACVLDLNEREKNELITLLGISLMN